MSVEEQKKELWHKLEKDFFEQQGTTCLCGDKGYDFCDYLFDCLLTEREKISQLQDRLNGYYDDPKCYHECPECQARCNCTYEKCNHCKDIEE